MVCVCLDKCNIKDVSGFFWGIKEVPFYLGYCNSVQHSHCSIIVVHVFFYVSLAHYFLHKWTSLFHSGLQTLFWPHSRLVKVLIHIFLTYQLTSVQITPLKCFEIKSQNLIGYFLPLTQCRTFNQCNILQSS